MDRQRVFKIKGPDGRYSTGGYSPGWLRTGKVWTRRADLEKHLKYITDYARAQYAKSEIVEYELVPMNVESAKR